MRRLAVCAVMALGACGSDGTDAATTTAARPSTTTTASVADERAFEEATALTFGIGTNPDKMLEYGYDLCALYDGGTSHADAIRDWAVSEGHPIAVASKLGAAASDHLCPD